MINRTSIIAMAITALGVSVTVHNSSDDTGKSSDLLDSSMNLEYLTDSFASGVFL